MTVRIRKQKGAVRRSGQSDENPAIMRALAKRTGTLSDFTPVDTLNTPIIDYNRLQFLPAPSHKKAVQWLQQKNGKGARAYSFVLRSAYAALEHARRDRPGFVLNHITVNFDHVQSEAIIVGNSKHAGAAYYCDKLIRRFKRGLPKQGIKLQELPQLSVSLEDSSDGSLHAHIIIVYYRDDKDALNTMLRIEAKQHDNAVMFQDTYRQWLDVPRKDPVGYRARSYVERLREVNELNHIDLEYDREYKSRGEDREPLCVYPRMGINKHGRVGFYRNAPIDAGVADYLCKELDKPVSGSTRATRLSMDGATKSAAAKIYKERYEQVKQSKEMQVPEEEPGVTQTDAVASPGKAWLEEMECSDGQREALRAILETGGFLSS